MSAIFCGDARRKVTWFSSNTYDGIVTFFFLIASDDRIVRQLVNRLKQSLRSRRSMAGQRFSRYQNGAGERWHAVQPCWSMFMYRFFRASPPKVLRTKSLARMIENILCTTLDLPRIKYPQTERARTLMFSSGMGADQKATSHLERSAGLPWIPILRTSVCFQDRRPGWKATFPIAYILARRSKFKLRAFHYRLRFLPTSMMSLFLFKCGFSSTPHGR